MSEVIDQSEQGVGATPETLRKLEPDWFLSLFACGKLDKDPEVNARMFDAGVEIRKTFDLITLPVSLKARDYAREVTTQDFEARERLMAARQTTVRRYIRWAEEMRVKRLPVGVVLDIVKDGLSLQQCDRARRKGTGYAGKVLRRGLRIYCEVAGWVRRGTT